MFWLHLQAGAAETYMMSVIIWHLPTHTQTSPSSNFTIISNPASKKKEEENTIKTMDHSHHAAMDHSHMDHGDMGGGGHDMPMCSMNVSWAIPSRASSTNEKNFLN
jgi:hypothetical protein